MSVGVIVKLLRLSLLTLLTLLLVSCGGGGDEGAEPPAQSPGAQQDRVHANTMLLELEDLGEDWTPYLLRRRLEYSLYGESSIPYDWFDPGCGVVPGEFLDILEPGATLQGNLCVQPDDDETDLILAIVLYPGTDDDQVYFSLE